MLKDSEVAFWRSLAWGLGIVLAVCVVANSILEDAVPSRVTLLLFGSLVALGVGNVVVNPRTSAVFLSDEEEARFRRGQYMIGFILSTILGLLMLLTDLGKSVLPWLFAPIVVLPYALLIREYITRE